MSVKFRSAILGLEMGASILWTPGEMRSLCRKNHVHKIPRFGGGGYFGFWGGGECRFYFYGRADFSDFNVGARARRPSSDPWSYHARLVEIVSQNSFVVVFMGGIAQLGCTPKGAYGNRAF